MKKQYTTPACTAISVRALQLLSASENEYSGNQGHIHFSSSEVDAGEAD